MSKVYISGYEVNCAQGNLEQTVEALKNGTTKISSKELSDIKIPFYALPCEVKQNQKEVYEVLKELVEKLVKNIDNDKRKKTALLIGTSIVDWNLVDAINASAYKYKKIAYSSQKLSIDSYAKQLSDEFGLSEFTMSINTACTSSANALLEAKNLINADIVESAIVIGIEIFSPIMSSGFYSMDLLSPTNPKPFDINRDGLVLGEAIAGIFLTNEPSLWSLEGGFSNCNSATITSVGESGEECREVMCKALEDSSLHVKDITALKAHATGSNSNDLAEMSAIKSMFDSSLVFTALKPYLGHTIGASGVLEIAVLIRAINEGFLPKTIYCDESISKEYIPIKKHFTCNDGVFMCNYFGFGGNNTSLIIKKNKS